MKKLVLFGLAICALLIIGCQNQGFEWAGWSCDGNNYSTTAAKMTHNSSFCLSKVQWDAAIIQNCSNLQLGVNSSAYWNRCLLG